MLGKFGCGMRWFFGASWKLVVSTHRECGRMMRNLRVAAVLAAGIAAFSPNLHGQSAQKPSSYSGVSQPPPDDTITSDAPATAAPSATAVTRRAPALAQAAAAPAPVP